MLLAKGSYRDRRNLVIDLLHQIAYFIQFIFCRSQAIIGIFQERQGVGAVTAPATTVGGVTTAVGRTAFPIRRATPVMMRRAAGAGEGAFRSRGKTGLNAAGITAAVAAPRTPVTAGGPSPAAAPAATATATTTTPPTVGSGAAAGRPEAAGLGIIAVKGAAINDIHIFSSKFFAQLCLCTLM